MPIDFQVEAIGPCKKKIAVTIPADRIQQELDSKYDEINDSVALKGFRPGHAPRKLLERRFADKLGDELKGDLVKTALDELVEERKLEPLKAPEIDLDALEVSADQSLSFEFELITKPEFETPDYKGLEQKVPPVEVTEEQIDRAVGQLLESGATLETVEDGVATNDDLLIVDWEARDGDSVEAQDSNFWYRVGRGVLAGFVAEGLDEQLLGQKVGAKAEASVQVAADDPREELRGRELDLRVELKEIKRYVLPALDTEFLKKFDYDDEAELRSEMRKQLQRGARRELERSAEHKLVDQLLGSLDITLPEEFVEGELEDWTTRKRMELEVEQVDADEIAKQIDTGRADAKSAIEKDMRRFFLLDQIAAEENVDVTEQEMLQAVQEIANAYGRPMDEVLGSLQNGNRLMELRTQIRHRKTREAIRSAATLVEDESLLGEDQPADAAAPEKKPEKKPKKKAKKKSTKDD